MERKTKKVLIGLVIFAIMISFGIVKTKAIAGLSFTKIDGNTIVDGNVTFSSLQPTFEGGTSVSDLISVYDHVEGVVVEFGKVSSESDLSITYASAGLGEFNIARTGMELNGISYMDLSPLDSWENPGVYFFGNTDQISLPGNIPMNVFTDSSISLLPKDIYVYLMSVVTPGGWMGATQDTISKITVYSPIIPSDFANKWVTFMNREIGIETKVDAYAKAFTASGENIYTAQNFPLQSSNGITYNTSSGTSTLSSNRIDTLIAKAKADSEGNWKAYYGKDENGDLIADLPSEVNGLHDSPFGLLIRSRDSGYSVVINAKYQIGASNNDEDGDGIAGQIESKLGLSDSNNQDISLLGLSSSLITTAEQNGDIRFYDGDSPIVNFISGTTVIDSRLNINIQNYNSGGIDTEGSARGMTSISPVNSSGQGIMMYIKNVNINADTLCITNKELTTADASSVTKNICENTWGGLYVGNLNTSNIPKVVTLGDSTITIYKEGNAWAIFGSGFLSAMEIVDPDSDGFDSNIDACPNVFGTFGGCVAQNKISSQLYSPTKNNKSYTWDNISKTAIQDLKIDMYQCSLVSTTSWDSVKKNKKKRNDYINKIKKSCQAIFSGTTDYYGKLDLGGNSGLVFLSATYTPMAEAVKGRRDIESLELGMVLDLAVLNNQDVNIDVLKYAVDNKTMARYAPLNTMIIPNSDLSVYYPEFIEANNSWGNTDVPVLFSSGNNPWIVNSEFDKNWWDHYFSFNEWDKNELVDKNLTSTIFQLNRRTKDGIANLKFSTTEFNRELIGDCLSKKTESLIVTCIEKKAKKSPEIKKQTLNSELLIGINDEIKLNIKEPKKPKIHPCYVEQKIKDLKHSKIK